MGIYEAVKRLEKLRVRRFILEAVLAAGVLGIMLIVLSSVGMIVLPSHFEPESLMTTMIFIGPLAIVVSSVLLYPINKEFKKLYKDTFVIPTLKEIFPDLFYDYEKGFVSSYVKEFGLTKLGNRYHSEDYLTATYKGIKFEQSDVIIKYQSSGKNKHTTTYFNGRMFVFEFPDKRVSSVKIFDERYMYRAKPALKLNKVNMENVSFNKRFDVLSNIEMDAFYILTPQLMEKITHIASNYGNIGLHFTGNKLYVGLPSFPNSFDAKPGRKIDYMTEKSRIKNDARVITDIIDTLEITEEEYSSKQL